MLLKHFDQNKSAPYSEIQIAIVMRQIINGLNDCHCRGIVHRDLKPDNLLIKKEETMMSSEALFKPSIKLTDFGMARIFEDEKTNVFQSNGSIRKPTAASRTRSITLKGGTSEYMAPERLKQQPYNEKSDIWSCGVILFMFLAGSFPFWGNSPQQILARIESTHNQLQSSKKLAHLSEDCKDLLFKMLQINPADRPSCATILEHPWLSGQTTSTSSMQIALQQLTAFNTRRKLRIVSVI
eukprot:Pgem_evm2s20028